MPRSWGIDWVIYNLGLALHGKPFRLPFIRQAAGTTKSKTEAEFGIDVAFLSGDSKRLTIFVLKDAPLTNKNWVNEGFQEDLTKAIAPDLNAQGLEAVENVEVILAYNRDEDANGLTLFDRFASNAPPLLAGRTKLSLARWNLSELVELVLKHLLTPALLPQRLFGQLSYLCAQVADFRHGSDEWERQLIPAWKRFLADVDDGEIVSRGPLQDSIDATAPELIAEMRRFVEQMRAAASFPDKFKVPMAPLFLASIRFKSPLPPEIWRATAFPRKTGNGAAGAA